MYRTPAGALALYQATLAAFQYTNGVTNQSIGGGRTTNQEFGAFVDHAVMAGVLTDELQAGDLGENTQFYFGYYDQVDSRSLPEGNGNVTDAVYTELQQVRGTADEGIGALAAYDDTAPPALRGHLYALQGYAEILLADLFCAGVPLSTLDFGGDYTYHAGSTTSQIYTDAIAKFDTAITLSPDSVRILNLARVGKGRAFLDLGQYDSAAAAVASVPDGFAYQFLVDWGSSESTNRPFFSGTGNTPYTVTVSDREGMNGLPFRSNGDPRNSVQVAGFNQFGTPQNVPLKYGGATPTVMPITVADWIEARLIQAEAAFHGVTTGRGSWLDQLNALRATAPIPGTTEPQPDALPPLTDPGSDSARVSLLFRERAYWLFVTGHRQGDLRRLIRQYRRNQSQVYPTGAYPLGSLLPEYGTAVTAPVPRAEHENPLFTGCLSRGA